MPGEIIENGTIVELGTDEVAWILSFLPLEKIMCLRRVNMTWRDAAKKTVLSPATAFWRVNNVVQYNAMEVMTRGLPNLQYIVIGDLLGSNIDLYGSDENYVENGDEHIYNNGGDPDEEHAAYTADRESHDIEIISNFSATWQLLLMLH